MALSWLIFDADAILAEPAPDFVAAKGVRYTDAGALMDVYQPANLASEARLPVLIFLNTGSTSQREAEFYVRWAKGAAAHGFVAVIPDLRPQNLAESFDQVVAYLAHQDHAAALHTDANRIAVYAGSGNVSSAFPLVEDPKRTTVKAAVIYYGPADVKEFRPDLPVLYVRAGLDRPPVNRAINDIAAAALAQNAPITLLNYAGGHHAFEMVDDNDATREVLDQTFQFLRSTLSPPYQAALRKSITEATAAGAVLSGDFSRAATLYSTLLAHRPEDPRLLLSYAEALLGAGHYKDARAQFDHLRPMHAVGPRDLGVPAATACILDGDPDAGIEWLKTIPKQFLPRGLMDDVTFRSVRERADFQALFH